MSLRRRLTVTIAVLLVVGLGVADVVTYAAVHSFLFGRIDEQLEVSQHQAYDFLIHEHDTGRTPTAHAMAERVGPDVYAQILGRGGSVVLGSPSGSPGDPDARPVLPTHLRVELSPRPANFGRRYGIYVPLPDAFTVGALGSGGPAYQAEAVRVPQGTLVTAIALQPTEQTLAALLRVEVIASAALIVLLCGVALWTVRRGLRPLEDMAVTAGAIASGDLSQRVRSSDGRSEIGRFGLALNKMLAQIESAFTDKSASEARLRQFVADASHELRTPLTSIRGYTELLRKGAFTDEDSRQRALSRVEAEATRMGRLVDDLLLLARLDQGRPLAAEPVDLRRLAADAVHDARAVEPARPLDLVAPSPVVVLGDRDRLGQCVHNLVRNAQTHTPPGTPVEVEIAAEGSMGVVRVIDHGPGLSPGAAARVFDRFYRADQARTGGGSGLGLAIVRAIAEALGGSAAVAGTPGGGATFVVAVPLDRGHGPVDRAVPDPAVPAGRSPQLTG